MDQAKLQCLDYADSVRVDNELKVVIFVCNS
jgi:hypothetical protein